MTMEGQGSIQSLTDAALPSRRPLFEELWMGDSNAGLLDAGRFDDVMFCKSQKRWMISINHMR
jgi:hypothetical protein